MGRVAFQVSVGKKITPNSEGGLRVWYLVKKGISSSGSAGQADGVPVADLRNCVTDYCDKPPQNGRIPARLNFNVAFAPRTNRFLCSLKS
jgi:hypothetical protein